MPNPPVALIIDDDPIQLKLTAGFLSKNYGFNCITIIDSAKLLLVPGKGTVEELSDQDLKASVLTRQYKDYTAPEASPGYEMSQVKVLVTDFEMPNGNGDRIIRLVKRLGLGDQEPILIGCSGDDKDGLNRESKFQQFKDARLPEGNYIVKGGAAQFEALKEILHSNHIHRRPRSREEGSRTPSEFDDGASAAPSAESSSPSLTHPSPSPAPPPPDSSPSSGSEGPLQPQSITSGTTPTSTTLMPSPPPPPGGILTRSSSTGALGFDMLEVRLRPYVPTLNSSPHFAPVLPPPQPPPSSIPGAPLAHGLSTSPRPAQPPPPPPAAPPPQLGGPFGAASASATAGIARIPDGTSPAPGPSTPGRSAKPPSPAPPKGPTI